MIVILPPQAQAQELSAGADVVEAELARQLASAGYKTQLVEKSDFSTLWNANVAAVGGLFDAATGQPKQDRYAQVLKQTTLQVASELNGALFIAPRIVYRAAALNADSAEWDGQRRRMEITEARGESIQSWSGSTRGVSIQITAMAPSGEIQRVTYGGLVLPYRVSLKLDQNVPKPDLFDQKSDVANGVATALWPLIGAR
ncbi:hypothetical protein [Ideonella sp.]|uniref:hypothetical protein n=1 Tax=Ideonella sp. TaxID=1929293 RepID=UPI003BB4E8CD